MPRKTISDTPVTRITLRLWWSKEIKSSASGPIGHKDSDKENTPLPLENVEEVSNEIYSP
jgi:hypothetical protein